MLVVPRCCGGTGDTPPPIATGDGSDSGTRPDDLEVYTLCDPRFEEYEDMHRLVDQLAPDQLPKVRTQTLQLVSSSISSKDSTLATALLGADSC